MDITIEAPRTTVEAPVSVTTGPIFNVAVDVPERPELAFNVLVEPVTIGVNVVTGGASGSASHVHTQSTPATEWAIATPWGVKPASVQLEIDGALVLPDVSSITPSGITLSFPTPTAGIATLIKGV